MNERESCSPFYLQSVPLGSTSPSGPGAEREPSSSSTPCCVGFGEGNQSLFHGKTTSSLPFSLTFNREITWLLLLNSAVGFFCLFVCFLGSGSPACSRVKSHLPGGSGKGSAPSSCAQALPCATCSSRRGHKIKTS